MKVRQRIRHAVALVSVGVAATLTPSALSAAPQGSQGRFEHPFQNPDLDDEARISDLIGRLTLEEKIDCLSGSASVPRLGVKGSPHIEGYHGVAQGGPSNWGRRNPTAAPLLRLTARRRREHGQPRSVPGAARASFRKTAPWTPRWT